MSVDEIISLIETLSLKELIAIFRLSSELLIKTVENNENL
jgi:hypothetical protein